MSNETNAEAKTVNVVTAAPGKTVKKPVKKAPVKKAAPKKAAKAAPAPAKKAAPKTKEAKSEKEEKENTRGPSKLQLQILGLLNKKGEMTRSQVSEALNGVFIGGRIMGHVDNGKLRPTSLVGRGLATINTYPTKNEGDGPAHYKITAAGKKVIEG